MSGISPSGRSRNQCTGAAANSRFSKEAPSRDAGQHVGDPRLRIDVTRLRRFDRRVQDGWAVPAGIRPTEGPVPPADRYAAHGALSGVVGYADAAVIQEPRERFPALQAISSAFARGFFDDSL